MVKSKIDIEQEVLDKLRSLEGTYWREATGELQEDYNECALFVLLFEDCDEQESHSALSAVLEPYMEAMAPVQFTVSYTILTDVFDVTVDTLMSNREILAAVGDPSFGKRTLTSTRGGPTMFKAKVSGNRPA